MICQKAKCSHGLVYHYFKNVSQIFDELLRSDTYIELSSSLCELDQTKEAYPQITEKVEKLLFIIDESKVMISFALILISDESKKSLFNVFSKLVLQGQKEKTITGGKPEDIVSVFFLLLKGLYQSLLLQDLFRLRLRYYSRI